MLSGLTSGEVMVKTASLYGKKSEKGMALVIVLILSAVALALMTALIYMITSGTQMSGLQKRYKSALEAGRGGFVLYSELIGLRGQSVDTTNFTSNLSTYGLTPSVPALTSLCTGSSMDGTSYFGLQARAYVPLDNLAQLCRYSCYRSKRLNNV